MSNNYLIFNDFLSPSIYKFYASHLINDMLYIAHTHTLHTIWLKHFWLWDWWNEKNRNMKNAIWNGNATFELNRTILNHRMKSESSRQLSCMGKSFGVFTQISSNAEETWHGWIWFFVVVVFTSFFFSSFWKFFMPSNSKCVHAAVCVVREFLSDFDWHNHVRSFYIYLRLLRSVQTHLEAVTNLLKSNVHFFFFSLLLFDGIQQTEWECKSIEAIKYRAYDGNVTATATATVISECLRR